MMNSLKKFFRRVNHMIIVAFLAIVFFLIVGLSSVIFHLLKLFTLNKKSDSYWQSSELIKDINYYRSPY